MAPHSVVFKQDIYHLVISKMYSHCHCHIKVERQGMELRFLKKDNWL